MSLDHLLDQSHIPGLKPVEVNTRAHTGAIPTAAIPLNGVNAGRVFPLLDEHLHETSPGIEHFQVDIAWSDTRLTEATITSLKDQTCTVRYGDRTVQVRTTKGKATRLDAELR